MTWEVWFPHVSSWQNWKQSTGSTIKDLVMPLNFGYFSSCSLINKFIHFLPILGATQQFFVVADTDMISSESFVLDIPLYFSETFSVFFLANLKVYVCDFLYLHIYDHSHAAGSANYCYKSITEADINQLERLLGNGFRNRSFLFHLLMFFPCFLYCITKRAHWWAFPS